MIRVFRHFSSFSLLAATVFASLALGVVPATAQFGAPPADQPDLLVDRATSRAVVESLAVKVEAEYVFPDVARRVAKGLRDRAKRGRYDSIGQAKELSDTLNADLRTLAHDLHLRLHYSSRPLPATAPNAGSNSDHLPDPAEQVRVAAQARRMNHGFDRVQRLAGNVGYLELRAFDGSPDAGKTAIAALEFLKNSDALIFDLRRNGGGDPNMIVLLLSHLYNGEDRVHVNDFYERRGDRTVEYWTSTTVPGPRFDGKEVFVLTSRRTGSAAEEFAYDIKNLKRGTLVGEVTAGGANPGGLFRLNDNFAAFIATGRAISPVTKTNWEGVGVAPDVATSADEALKTAHVMALTNLQAKATDPELKGMYDRALDQAKNAPVEPVAGLGGPAGPAAKR